MVRKSQCWGDVRAAFTGVTSCGRTFGSINVKESYLIKVDSTVAKQSYLYPVQLTRDKCTEAMRELGALIRGPVLDALEMFGPEEQKDPPRGGAFLAPAPRGSRRHHPPPRVRRAGLSRSRSPTP